nr:2-dehydro-3-deoxy-6-phosphogalactonate aldolase [Amaricoccus sp.]
MTLLAPYLERLPLVAILRGVTPAEAVGIGRALVRAGFSIIEVPLNSPDPIESIRRLASDLGPDTLVGAGTVTAPADVEAVVAAGGPLIVLPPPGVAVNPAAQAAGAACTPRISTPTQGFPAL